MQAIAVVNHTKTSGGLVKCGFTLAEDDLLWLGKRAKHLQTSQASVMRMALREHRERVDAEGEREAGRLARKAS